MALRFRRSLKLAPGIRMNLSGSGISWSLGPRGASIGIGRRGTYLNTGIPGTGLYSRSPLGNNAGQSQNSSVTRETRNIEITVSISDDGVLTFRDSQGNLIPEAQIEMAKKQQGEKIKALIQGKCDEINAQIEALGDIHLYTPPPLNKVLFEPQKFETRPPYPPTLKAPGFFCRLFKSCVARVEAENAKKVEEHAAGLAEWNQQKVRFEESQVARRQLIDRVNGGDSDAMERYLAEALNEVVWPGETNIGLDISDSGSVVALDVDLPEIEEMPTKTAAVPQRGFRLSVKDMGPVQVQKLYMRHIHAVGFRLLGEAFAALPSANTVVLSAYSQRPSKTTGQVSDEYLYSVRVSRDEWRGINFGNLDQIDIVDSLASFELRRDMTKTGIFKPVQPISP